MEKYFDCSGRSHNQEMMGVVNSEFCFGRFSDPEVAIIRDV